MVDAVQLLGHDVDVEVVVVDQLVCGITAALVEARVYDAQGLCRSGKIFSGLHVPDLLGFGASQVGEAFPCLQILEALLRPREPEFTLESRVI